MNITAVAIYAEADRDSLHVEQADEAYSLGEGPAANTYLDQEKIITIAKQSGAQAIHPGYGFLSENPNFVQRCQQENITFIGPSVENMQAFALKHSARALAEKHKVPLVPGSDLLENKASAIDAAKNIGYPIMLKSSAGGGGIGMQICRDEKELEKTFDSVVQLSQNNFSDGRVFIEKYIEHARHIEVQVFGNGLGEAVDLGERDCSLQRRNQKVIEEAPAPNLDEKLCQALHHTATQLLAGVNYANAGTVEFIFDTRDDSFYFLEVNTRLQVEHGVTEEIYQVDLVQWMIEQAYSPLKDLSDRRNALQAKGHAIQTRVYAENPALDFQPAAGLLSHVQWHTPEKGNTTTQRIDTWIRSGIEVSPYFDPMLAKVIVWGEDREQARKGLQHCLAQSDVYGIETNINYAKQLLNDALFIDASMTTHSLNHWQCPAEIIEVLSPGTMTTIQDYPGRIGYWEVGVPPSGPFDNYSFALGNQLLNNNHDCAGLEITIQGPRLKFHADSEIVITGADIEITLDDAPISNWQVIPVKRGQILQLGKIIQHGARAYLLIKDGIRCPDYLGSKSTFTLGQFGGHAGRALRTGDILKFAAVTSFSVYESVDPQRLPSISNNWELNVIYGPHGAPDFFTDNDIATFFSTEWEVHYNSSRTGIRLIGPKPEWARETGGEAGMHPSNIHDNAYAFGTVDFTGDMPVILGPDGPSLGGFVCPATVIHADLWKLGQLRAGDKIRFKPVAIDDAVALNEKRQGGDASAHANISLPTQPALAPDDCIIKRYQSEHVQATIRAAGDQFLLVEFGEQTLDLRLRFQVHALREIFRDQNTPGILDLTPGIRSLQIHFDSLQLPHQKLLSIIEQGLESLAHQSDVRVPSRIIHLPLSWDDPACQEAIDKYMQSVRKDAPWCPSNIEFIRRINGFDNIGQVKDIVFNANYVVMGLGDVYLGAPVATPLDPRHRLVTTKYNPARTWTAENSVGIGGAYMCVYGMEGPGGYQFVGRTLQMWNRYRETSSFSQPWLLRFFDQIKFFPVSHDELQKIRRDFPNGKYKPKIEHCEFSLRDYEAFLATEKDSIQSFTQKRDDAFDEELQRWRDSGQLHFDSQHEAQAPDDAIPDNVTAIESAVAGSVWKLCVSEGQRVQKGEVLMILESMKMEIEITAPQSGTVNALLKSVGAVVSAGQALAYLEE